VPGQYRGQLVEPVGLMLGERLSDDGVELGSSPGQQRLVGHFLGEGMPEAVLGGGVVPHLLEEFGGGKRPQRLLQGFLRLPGHRGQHRSRKVRPMTAAV
jgi:hypothetical protein